MTIIDTKDFDFAYKAMQYPLPPTWKYAIRQQDQIMWLLQALLTINDEYSTFDEAIAELKKLVADTIAEFDKIIAETKKEFTDQLDAVQAELNAVEGLQAILVQMQNELKTFKTEKLDTGVYMNQWFTKHIDLLGEWFHDYITEEVAKQIHGFSQFVSFGLDDDGYFVTYVPKHWSELEFSTGTDYDNPNEYGHLILNYV